jgi:hypothetical protein
MNHFWFEQQLKQFNLIVLIFFLYDKGNDEDEK